MSWKRARARGRLFISFEGIGGAGKTTQAKLLHDYLVAAGHRVVVTREPGGTDVGEQLRSFLLKNTVTPWCEAALFAASRAQLVHEVIEPSLKRGETVICDRYIDSSLAYQGIVRGLGVESILDLNLPGLRGRFPDRTYLLKVDPEEAGRRRLKIDAIETRDLEERRKVVAAYDEVSKLFPDRIVPIDARGTVSEVAASIQDDLRVGT